MSLTMNSAISSVLTSQLSHTDVAIISIVLGIGAWYLLSKRNNAEHDVDMYLKEVQYIDQPDESSKDSLYDKMKSTDRTMVVFYGSQTGTAEEFANRLAKDAARYGMKALVADPEEVNFDDLTRISLIENSLAVFCLATYGEGDPTDNTQEFYEWLKAGEADLGNLNFAVFGLGNKTYEHFNAVGIYTNDRLAEINGNRICELGLGDDDGNIEDDFITWKDKFWLEVCEKFKLHEAKNLANFRQYQLIVHENREEFYKDGKPVGLFTGEPYRIGSYESPKPPHGLKNPILTETVNCRELYKGNRSCMHIEFDLKGKLVAYDTGDHLVVFPENDPDLVNQLGELLNIDLDEIITMKCLDVLTAKKYIIPCPCTFRTAFTYYVDIASSPRMHTLRDLASFAQEEEHKNFLELVSSSTDKGKSEYAKWILKDCRNIVQVISDLPSFKPPADLLIELMPRLQPRYYSVSSSNKANPDVASITAVVVEYETPAGHFNKGVATNFLKRKTLQNKNGYTSSMVPMCFVKSNFRLPIRGNQSEDKNMPPIIMIGPGTGLAPFRGFLQEIEHLKKNENLKTSDIILYYGCRNKNEDYLYEDELNNWKDNGTLTQLNLAFSRDQPEKVYVTHLLEKKREETWDIIGNRKGYVYVCGEARSMAKNVHQLFKSIIMEQGKLEEKAAEAFLKEMETSRRYQADVWS